MQEILHNTRNMITITEKRDCRKLSKKGIVCTCRL